MELRHGNVERRPTLHEYLHADRGLGLASANEEIGLRQPVDTAGLFLKGVRQTAGFPVEEASFELKI